MVAASVAVKRYVGCATRVRGVIAWAAKLP